MDKIPLQTLAYTYKTKKWNKYNNVYFIFLNVANWKVI